MEDEPVASKTRLSLDGEWSLLDWSSFGRRYVQVYSFLYAIEYGVPEDFDDAPFGFKRFEREQFERAFKSFSWEGGWSAFGFYEFLWRLVPEERRPRIVAIRYESPGFIDLGVFLSSALAISMLVRHVCTSIQKADDTYHQVYTHAQERKLLRRRADRELNLEDVGFVDEASKLLSTAIGFKGMDNLRRLTENPLVQMKILLSLFRRVRALAEFQDSGQIKFDEDESGTDTTGRLEKKP